MQHDVVSPINHSSSPKLGIQVLWHTSLQAASKLLGNGIAFFIFILTTRLFGDTTTYGEYAIVFVYLSLFGNIAEAGLAQIGVREATKTPQDLGRILGATTALKMILVTIAFGLATIIALFLPYSNAVKSGIVIIAIANAIYAIGTNFDIAFQSRLQTQTMAVADVAFKVVWLGGTITLFVIGHYYSFSKIVNFYCAISIAAGVYILNSLIRWHGAVKICPVRLRLDPKYWGEIIKLAAPIGIASILSQIHYKADTVLLSLMCNQHDVGVYSVAYKIIDIITTLFMLCASFALPLLTRYLTSSHEIWYTMTRRVLDAGLTLGVPLAIGCNAIAPYLIPLMSGNEFRDAVLPFQILAIALIPSLLTMLAINILIVLNRQWLLLFTTTGAIILNVGLNLYVIPRGGFIGSAIVTVISETASFAMLVMISYRSGLLLPTRKTAIRVLFASSILWSMLFALSHSSIPHLAILPAMIIVGSIAYCSALLAVGGIDPGIRSILRQRVVR
jgi:O-antigen/teichoic acid export membrane protein